MGYITEEEANEAKEVAILDTIKPESSQYSNIIAPHFVLSVRKQLEEKYGVQTIRSGGWTIKTTIDSRAQQIAEDAINVGKSNMWRNNSNNLALVSVDVETSQIIAMVGSADFSNPVYGEQNVTVDSLIEPGSSIKPILDYAPLFMQREGINYSPGTILRDENIDRIYCAGYTGTCMLRNATRQFYGPVTIRFSLGHSLSIPAVKALYINGIDNSLEVARALGDKTYCENRDSYGLAIAIGSGCNVRMVEHANAYASIARGGSYKDLAYILEVKNSSGEVIESWTDKEAVRVVDEQVAYMISDILGDRSARWFNNEGFVVPDVWTATKTGTTTTADPNSTKDSLFESYSTALSTFVWNGNHDGSAVSSNTHDVVRFTAGAFMERVHKEVYEPEGKWHYGDVPVRPAGIQTLTVNGKTDIFPSWYNASKNSGVKKDSMTFNRYNHLLAADCTKEDYKIAVEVTKITDPMTGNEVVDVPEPYKKAYEEKKNDTCNYKPPAVSLSTSGDDLIATISKSTYPISGHTLYINGTEKSGTSLKHSGGDRYTVTGYTPPKTGSVKVKLMVTDQAGYTAVAEITVNSGNPQNTP